MAHRLCVLLVILPALIASGGGVPAAEAQYFAFGKNRVQYEDHDWRMLESTHFDVYFYEVEGRAPSGRTLATFAADAAEEAYGQVAGLFESDIKDRIALLIYPTHREFGVTNAVDLGDYPDGIGGVTELYKNRVAVPFTGDWGAFRRVIHHELVHAVINDLFYGGSVQALLRSGLRLRLPLWFNEGLAEYSALGWDTNSDMYLREAILEDRLPDISRLRGYFAYRGGQGVWDFIAQEYGPEKVTEILERTRLAGSVESAIERSTGLSLEELSDRWRATLRTVYYPEIAARQDLRERARPVATRELDGAGYRSAPALSPQGDRVAYIASRDGLFDVYIASTAGTASPRVLVEGQESTSFERLRLLTPGLAWSPDGRTLAVAVSSGPSDAVAFVDAQSGDARLVRLEGVDAVLSLAWDVETGRLALAGTAGAHSDLFLMDPETGATTNLTNDLHSDHAPAWLEGDLVFHSDRGDALAVGQQRVGTTSARALRGLGRRTHDIYRLPLDSLSRPASHLTRITRDSLWDATHAQAARGRLLFISDRNGIPNLIEKNLETGAERFLTDLQSGVTGISLSADGGRAAVLALDEGVPSVFLLRDPFGEAEAPEQVAPTVWALRKSGEVQGLRPPSLQVAATAVSRRNALLRDAADGVPMAAQRPEPRRPIDPATVDSLLAEVLQADLRGVLASTDTAAMAVDFRRYTFSDAFEAAAQDEGREVTSPFAVTDNRAEDGEYRVRRYRLRFTPDLVTATGGYDTVYGLQSVTRMLFSDVTGNHRVSLATNLVLDLRNADYLLSYQNRAGRTDWGVQGFHLARELPDIAGATVFRYRNYGLGASVSYPFSKFHRVEADLSLLGVSLADLGDLAAQPTSRLFLTPRLTYTRDVTTPGLLGPGRGRRWAVSLSGTPGPDVRFVTALADGRQYVPLGLPGYTLALRGSAGLSLGANPQRFYAAGVQNWLNPTFRSLPVTGPDDFIFATPVLPLRGFGYDEARGDRFALVNVEARMPLVAALLPGPLPMLPLYNLQAVAFADAGFIAEGAIDVWREREVDTDGDGTPDTAERVFDDVLLGTGVGLRTIVFGFPLRADWAWAFDGQAFGPDRIYLSIGLDF